MANVDVAAEIEIAAEPTDVAGVMFDPHRDPEWMKAVTAVDVIDPGIKPGARVRRTGQFMGHEVSWTTEVASFQFPHLLVLNVKDGPFVGSVRYEVGRSGAGSIARIRTAGSPTAFGFLPSAMIEGPLRTALQADLARLKALIER
jgi:hypothetical protein